ncbi:hypothetical protein Tco_1383883, partial [Tanacetum coccineum]
LGWHFEEIHVTWAIFWIERDKIATSRDDGSIYDLPLVETASRIPATPSGLCSDRVRRNCDGVRIVVVISETLEDLT